MQVYTFLIIELSKSKSKIVFKDLPQDDPRQRKPDISIAKDNFNWEPKINLKDGLAKTIQYFKSILQIIQIKDIVIFY